MRLIYNSTDKTEFQVEKQNVLNHQRAKCELNSSFFDFGEKNCINIEWVYEYAINIVQSIETGWNQKKNVRIAISKEITQASENPKKCIDFMSYFVNFPFRLEGSPIKL